MTSEELAFVVAMRVGRLATIRTDGTASQVPICYAVLEGEPPAIVSVLDEKPKRVTDRELARVRNIRRDPRVGLLVDRYDEDWSRLAFVQITGDASIIAPGEAIHALTITALREKYPQYRSMAIEHRPVILIEPLRSSSWGLT